MNETYPAIEELEALAGSNGWVFALAKRLVGDSHEAEDLVQEAYLQALSAPAAPRQSMSAWFAGVVRNLARSSARERGRRRDREEQSAHEEDLGSTVDNVSRLEQQTLLIQALLSLDETHRTALMMRYVDGLPPRTIAAQLNVPVATINSRLARALEKLRTKLCAAHGGDRHRWLAAFAPLLGPPTATVGPSVPLALGALLMKYKIASAAALLVVGVASWLVLTNLGLPPRENATRVVPTQEVLSPEAPAGERDTALHFPEHAPSDRQVVLAEDSSRDSPGERTVRMTVRGGLSGHPIVGTQVHVWSWENVMKEASAEESLAVNDRMPLALRDLVRRSAPCYQTDEEGQVPVPEPNGVLQYFAERGEQFGNGDYPARSFDLTLVVVPDRRLEVRVVDAKGKSLVGVPVALGPSYGDGVFPISTARTELTADGQDVLAELVMPGSAEDGLGDGLHVALRFPVATAVSQRVTLLDWPETPVVLKCPPIGSVLVRTQSETNTPALSGAVVRLGKKDPPDRHSYGRPADSLSGLIVDGTLRLWPVGLDLELAIAGYLHGDLTPKVLVVEGPRHEGETVAVVLATEGTPVRLHGRVLETNGKPCVEGWYYLDLAPGAVVAPPPLTVIPDAEGRFEVDHFCYPGHSVGAVFELLNGSDGKRILEGTLPSVSNNGTMDLGDLQIEAASASNPDSRVSGTVVDTGGTPVPEAFVNWVDEEALDSSSGNSGVVSWAMTDSNGSFTLSGEGRGAGASLQVDAEGVAYHEPVFVKIPAADVLLRVDRGGTISGMVLLEQELPSRRVFVDLWDEALGEIPWRMDLRGHWTSPLMNRRFEYGGMVPGSYSLRVAAVGDLNPVILRGIRVRDSGLVDDPRLDAIDLTGRYLGISLKPVDEEGNPVDSDVHAFRRVPTTENGHVVLAPEFLGSTDEGPLLITRDGEHTLVVHAAGYFPVRVDPANPDDEIVLKTGIVVCLKWVGPMPLVDLPFKLQYRLEKDVVFGASRDSEVTAFMEWRSPGPGDLPPSEEPELLRIIVPGPGTYRLRWRTDYGPIGNVHLGRVVDPDRETSVLVEAADDPPTFVSLARDVLERETEWLRERFKLEQAEGRIPGALVFGEKMPAEDE